MSDILSNRDVKKLSKKLPQPLREDLARVVVNQYQNTVIDDSQRHMAEEIFRILACDAEVTVRKILSESLKNEPSLPHDVALQLAQDVAKEVSSPLLQYSDVLTDADLVQLVTHASSTEQRLAIASRAHVSETVSEALVDTGEKVVMDTLVSNKGAEINEASLGTIVETFKNEESVLEKLVTRGSLPATIAERMLTMVSDRLRQDLVQRYHLSPYTIQDVVQDSNEWALLSVLHPQANTDIEALTLEMYRAKRLSPSIIMRALCMGNMRFFVSAMARLAQIPTENAAKLMSDSGSLGFKALYKAAGMPPGVFDAIRVLIRLVRVETNDGTFYSPHFHTRIVERILEGGYDTDVDNMAYMMSVIGRSIPRLHQRGGERLAIAS
jgi:uncharacterized protein (DUF2336 family)